ncbi:MAG: TonB-dependent receptor [Acidobacteriaceae bacterium]|nr:TonB-dependent receptor [Acidobacteriaceae bacterium]
MTALFNRRFRTCFLLAAAIAVGTIPGYGQFSSSIEGVVTDSSGAAVSKATVELTRVETGVTLTATTNDSGNFTFPTLAAGGYRVSVTATGFDKTVIDNVLLQPSQVRSVPIQLAVGRVQTAVEVTAGAEAVQTDESKITSTVSQLELNELPLPGRNVLNAINLTPGVTGTGMMGNNPAGVLVSNQFPAVSANGQPNSANMFYIDGTTVNDSPSSGDARIVLNPDAISEMVVSANEFSAQFGRGSGVVVQMFSRAGVNQFHGSLYEYLQNSALNARNIFQNQVLPNYGRVLIPSRSNEFGGAFGGPILKNKTFFWFSWDQLISEQPQSNVVTVETPQLVSWMTSNLPNNLSTQLLKSYTPSAVNLQNFQTVSQVLQSELGQTCSGSGPSGLPCSLPILATGTHTFSNPNDGHQWTLRVDQNFTNDRLYFNYIGIIQTTTSDNVRPQWNKPVPVPSWYSALDWTHTFSSTVLNEMSLGGTHNSLSINCKICTVPQINPGPLPSFGDAGFAPINFAQADLHWRDIVSLSKGKHTVKAGLEIFENQDFATFTNWDSRPTFNFNNVFQFVADTPQSETGPYSYNPLTGALGDNNHYWMSFYYGGFVQDDYKIKPNLTISAGLRYEYQANPYERHGNRDDLFLGAGPGLGNEIANSYVKQDKYAYNGGVGRFAPRFSFAWQPGNSPNWSIRGGWGMFVNRGGNTIWSDTAAGNPPLTATLNLNITNPTGPYPSFALCNSSTFPFECPIPALPTLGLNPRGGVIGTIVNAGGPDMNMKLSYAENRFFGVQRSFHGDWLLEADYTGSHGVDLYAERNLNTYVGNMLINNGKFVGLNPYFANIIYADNSNFSQYNALALSLRKAFSHGLVFKTVYTESRTIDDVSGAPGQNKTEGALVINPWNINNQKATSSQDIPHQLVFDFVYQIPTPNFSRRVERALLRGWEFSGIGTFTAGLPFTVYSGTGNWGSQGIYYDLPNAPTGALAEGGYTRTQYLNGIFPASDFPSPCPAGTSTALGCGVEGNLGRNTYRGPYFAQVDAGFTKNSKIPWFTAEGAELQFRAEIANVLNRVNLTGMDGNLADGNFGRATGVGIARTPQFSIRIHF